MDLKAEKQKWTEEAQKLKVEIDKGNETINRMNTRLVKIIGAIEFIDLQLKDEVKKTEEAKPNGDGLAESKANIRECGK